MSVYCAIIKSADNFRQSFHKEAEMPTLESIEKLRKKRFIKRKAAEKEARILGKSEAITPELVAEMAERFNRALSPDRAVTVAEVLATEHRYFENSMSPAELEQFSHQTVVGIGEYYYRGKNRGYVLVLNKLKTLGSGVPGLGFPGGRVRLGESPNVRLMKEFLEESGLNCEVVNPDQSPVAEHNVGEEEHRFSAYKVKITGGKPQPNPTKDEPITAIIFIDEQTLKLACRDDGRIKVKIGKRELVVGILRSHRLVFLEYLRKKEAEEAANV